MAELLKFAEGGYRFIRGVFPYSAGVAAEPGFRIERACFARPPGIEEGFRLIRARLAALGRPPAALCACELRSPAPFTEQGFTDFNRGYVGVLRDWGIVRDGLNPVARSNVCPVQNPPASPVFHAFSYTVPGDEATFVASGNGEAPEGKPTYRDHIVRLGDCTPEGLREKVRWVLAEQERRVRALGFRWGDVSTAQVYTIRDAFTLAATELVQRGVMGDSVTLHPCRPPVVDIEFEMDCRAVTEQGDLLPG